MTWDPDCKGVRPSPILLLLLMIVMHVMIENLKEEANVFNVMYVIKANLKEDANVVNMVVCKHIRCS